MKNKDACMELIEKCMLGVCYASFLTKRVASCFSVQKEDRSIVTAYDISIQILFASLLKEHDVDIVAEEENTTMYRKILSVLSEEEDSQEIDEGLMEQLKDIRSFFLQENISIHKGGAIYQKIQNSERISVIIDPIDGTRGFINNRLYSIVLSILHKNKSIFSVISSPKEGKLFYKMSIDAYAYRKRVKAVIFQESVSDTLKEFLFSLNLFIALSAEKNHSNKILEDVVRELKGIYQMEVLGIDGQGKYAYLSTGEIDLFVRLPTRRIEEKIWDHSAGIDICSSCVVTDALGNVLESSSAPEYGVIAAFSPEVHRTVLEVVTKHMSLMSEH
ncbi:3'(2'), 5'-bisphosphate nucleotidase [Nematocida sp. LUAm3]|nr:3'(2'), 5'-bisphosphate nucleotidase [Nematocida sp. LUAm3]KAI5174043.1 3'(2'), 5'-bisphosphate nucleotidase [Nematocida sp. LUAm2]KAI5177214.1 3'(2'), 5'-bisphosphate nucleotidase [Nematocida sp. LUAm1]